MNALGLQPNGNSRFDVMDGEEPKLSTWRSTRRSRSTKTTYDTMRLQEPTHFQVENAELEIQGFASYNAFRKYKAKLVSNVSGVPIEAVKRMRISEVEEAFDFLARFTERGPETGAN